MIRRPPRSTQSRSSAASDVYKRQDLLVPEPGDVLLLVGAPEDPLVHPGLELLFILALLAQVHEELAVDLVADSLSFKTVVGHPGWMRAERRGADRLHKVGGYLHQVAVAPDEVRCYDLSL